MGAYTKLQAINEMLLLSGESPVSDLDGSSGVDTSVAETILDQKTIDAQARGLANNLTIRTISPDASGKLYVPADCLSATMLTAVSSARSNSGGIPVQLARVTTRGWENVPNTAAYFYNLTDGTDVFPTDHDYDIEVILDVSWEDMDTPVQKDITTQAARQYQMLTQGDGAVDSYIAQLEQFYGAKSKGADMRSKDYNIFNMNPLARRAIDRQILVDPERFRYWRGGRP